MQQQKTNIIKKIISWSLGLPSALLLLGEINDLKLWWIQIIAILTLTAILIWNGAFKEAR